MKELLLIPIRPSKKHLKKEQPSKYDLESVKAGWNMACEAYEKYLYKKGWE